MMFCRKCGSEIPDDSIFCMKCGTQVEILENKIEKAETNSEKAKIEIDTEVPKEESKIIDVKTNRTHKKIIYGIIVGVIVIIVLALVINNSKKCSFGGCDNTKIEGSNYCLEHTCKANNCTKSKSKSDTYCYEHKEEYACNITGCKEYRIDSGKYCYEHTCMELSCTNKKENNSNYCSIHRIDMRKKLGSEISLSVNSAGGIKLRFRGRNNSDKEIKYIRFNANLKNAVGDMISDKITQKTAVLVEITGPIKLGKSADFDDIIGYNSNCARVDIDDVTLVYTDGTSQTGQYNLYVTK